MGQHIELFRIVGIPVLLDLFFILMLLIVFGPLYFVGGDSQSMSLGVVIIMGLVTSILLHELGHAFAARYFGIPVRHIELTALGGLAQFERSLPPSAFIKSVIFLAGPAVNFALYFGFEWLAGAIANPDSRLLLIALITLSSMNLYLAIFNLLPAFPLDGGQTLNAWLDWPLGAQRSVKIVAGLGLLIAAYFAITALPTNFWRLVLAFFLFQANWLAWQSAGRWR